MQQILELLASMNLGESQGGSWSGSWQDIPNITGGDIGEALGDLLGFGADFDDALFQPISTQQMQNLLPGTYSPFMIASQQPLLANLLKTSEGKEARKAAGGFAGSGAYEQFKGRAKDVYGKGMTDTLSGIAQSRGEQQAAIMDLINQWRETAMGLTSPTGG
tara:strand:+ start:11869 stop:12354 length:486 start_codon:yes stop_codon:yes gene_type:complete